MNTVKNEEPVQYLPDAVTPLTDDEVINRAIFILQLRLTEPGAVMENPNAAKQYVFLKVAELKHEVFACLFLDNRNRMIAFKQLFNGTIDGCSVHPREVVREVIEHNAAAIIMVHNHPSGEPEPSQADIRLTKRIVEAMTLIDVRVLDHLVVGDSPNCVSFAERGLI